MSPTDVIAFRPTAAAASFVRHRGPVTCVAGIPGRAAAVSSGYDGAIAYVDFEARTLELLGYHEHLANRVSVDPAGRRAASSSSDYSIYLWDLATRCRTLVLRGHSDDVEDFCFVGEDVGVSVSRDCRILVWNLRTGAITAVLEGHARDVLSVVHADGRLYTSGDDHTLRMWDLARGQLLHTWGPYETEVDTCAIDPQRGRAVLGCDDGAIRVFDIESGRTVAEIPAHASGIKRIAVSPTGGEILSSAYDQQVRLWNAEDFRPGVSLESRPATWERSLSWSPDGRSILAGTFDGTVLVWDAASGRCLSEVGEPGSGNACLNDVAADGDGDFVTVSDDGLVRLGRLTPSEARWLCTTAPASGRRLANAVTQERAGLVVSGAHDQRLHVFERRGPALEERLAIPVDQGPINCVRIARHPGYEGELFVACYSGAIVRLAAGGGQRQVFRVHDNAVKALRLHPRRPLGVSCSADGGLAAWTLDGHVLRRFPGHTAIVDDVDLDPEGRRLASVSRDFTLKVFDLEEGRLLSVFSLGRRSPKGVCFFDEDTIVVGNYWGALIRVDLRTGGLLSRTIAQNGISAVVRSGEHLLAVSYDGGAYLVASDDLRVVNELRAMTQRLQRSALL